MAILTVGKAFRGLRKGPALLRLVLDGVTQEQAQNAWDADWNVVYIVCHLRDLEAVFLNRLHLMLEQNNPDFPPFDQNDAVVTNRYADTDMRAALAAYEEHRRTYIALMEELQPEQWERRGQHPAFGETTVLTAAINSSNHDLDHIEQIARALGRLETWH